MLKSKPWWTSKGVIGGVVATIGGAAGLSAVDIAEWPDILISLATSAGGLFAIYGRIVATRTVTK